MTKQNYKDYYYPFSFYGPAYDKHGYDEWGYDKDGYNEDGYNDSGYDRFGFHFSDPDIKSLSTKEKQNDTGKL